MFLPPGWPKDSDWTEHLIDVFQTDWFMDLQAFVSAQRDTDTVYPPQAKVFSAFELTPFSNVRVCILGQDPYHGEGQANGLAFSVNDDVKLPPSLRNIFKELVSDCGCPMPSSGNLQPWARQGVFLLNTVLTVRQSSANSHRNQGWEKFTDYVIRLIAGKEIPIAFVLWGKHASAKKGMIDNPIHHIIESAHPSPLSARNGFFNSRPFTRVNRFLEKHDRPIVNWNL